MPVPSQELIEFLTQNPLPWISYDEQKQKLVLIVDNYLLSNYRTCAQHFVHAHVFGWKRRDILVVSGTERNWFLDFGVILHKLLEQYYLKFREADFEPIAWITAEAPKVWLEAQMDVHAENKEYKSMGGLGGFLGLLVQYALIHNPTSERIRVLGTEVSFGRNLEVPLLITEDLEVYLAGRMDMIVDDGYFICPMDHKTMGSFRGDLSTRFEMDEAPTGYIYALKSVLPGLIPEDQLLKRDCSKILMNLISKAGTPIPAERFKRIALRKTDWQLEEYRLRMADTAIHLVETMERVAVASPVARNTTACTNWMRSTCVFLDVCRQQSAAGAETTLKNGFVRVKVWNTEEVTA